MIKFPSRILWGARAALLVAVGGAALLVVTRGGANAPVGRYTVGADSVTDNQTGLVWEKTPSTDSFSRQTAQTHCAGLTIGGVTGRLPSIKELQTLVDETRHDPAIDPTVFFSAPSGLVLTSSDIGDGPFWGVDFSTGGTAELASTTTCSVRCVR